MQKVVVSFKSCFSIILYFLLSYFMRTHNRQCATRNVFIEGRGLLAIENTDITELPTSIRARADFNRFVYFKPP